MIWRPLLMKWVRRTEKNPALNKRPTAQWGRDGFQGGCIVSLSGHFTSLLSSLYAHVQGFCWLFQVVLPCGFLSFLYYWIPSLLFLFCFYSNSNTFTTTEKKRCDKCMQVVSLVSIVRIISGLQTSWLGYLTLVPARWCSTPELVSTHI